MAWSEAPGKYIAEDYLIWPQWEWVCLIFQRLDAPERWNDWRAPSQKQRGEEMEKILERGDKGQHLGCEKITNT